MREDREKATGELLAIIHRDGGHYQDEHGTVRALQDAVNVVITLRTELDHALSHKDDPITASFPCPECEGTGMKQVSPGHHMDASFTCPHCKDGLIEMTLVAVEGETCMHWITCKGNEITDCPPEFLVEEQCIRGIEIPLTYATWQNHKFEDMEWRVM